MILCFIFLLVEDTNKPLKFCETHVSDKSIVFAGMIGTFSFTRHFGAWNDMPGFIGKCRFLVAA